MAEIGIRLTGDNSNFRGMLDDSTAKGEEFAGKLANKIGTKLYGLQQVSHAVATALGLNIEKIAENLARWFTGMSKAEEDAYKKAGELSDEITEARKKNMLAMLSEEQKYTMALKERDNLIAKIGKTSTATGAGLLQQKELELALENKSAEIREMAAKRNAQIHKDEEAMLNADISMQRRFYEGELAMLSTQEKIESLKKEILATDSLIENGTLTTQHHEAAKVRLLELQQQLRTELARQQKDEIKTQAEFRKDLNDFEVEYHKQAVADAKERATLLLKGADNLTAAEKVRLEILTNQTTQEKINAEIIDLTAKLVDGTLNPAEEKRLRLLTGQLTVLEEQEASASRFVEITRVGMGYAQQSTEALEGVAARLKSQLDAVSMANAMIPDIGYKNPMETMLRIEYTNAQNELRQRSEIQSYLGRYGESATRRQYGDTLTQAALSTMQDATKQTVTALSWISRQIAEAGVGKALPAVWPGGTP